MDRCVESGGYFSLVLESIIKKIKEKKIYMIFLLGILVFGIYDQTPAYDAECYSTTYDVNTKKFIQQIEDLYPESVILQLPNVKFPENGILNMMKDYSHFIGYLYSDNLKWSYGAYKGREGSTLLNNLCGLPVDRMIWEAAEVGYNGIYIDRYGYTAVECENLENEICEIIKQDSIVSDNNRYVYFSLNQYIEDNRITHNEETLVKNLIMIENGLNMYSKEKNDTREWYWCQHDSVLKITNFTGAEINAKLSFDLNIYGGQTGDIVVSVNESVDKISVATDNYRYEKVLRLKEGTNEILLSSNMVDLPIDSGQRQVCFALVDVECEIQ